MRDAERVEAAHSRLQKTGKDNKKPANYRPEQQKPVPMDIGNVQLRKRTREERETCKRKVVVFAAAKTTHGQDCPNARGTEYDDSTEILPSTAVPHRNLSNH